MSDSPSNLLPVSPVPSGLVPRLHGQMQGKYPVFGILPLNYVIQEPGQVGDTRVEYLVIGRKCHPRHRFIRILLTPLFNRMPQVALPNCGVLGRGLIQTLTCPTDGGRGNR